MKILYSCLFLVSVMSLGDCEADNHKRVTKDNPLIDIDEMAQDIDFNAQELQEFRDSISKLLQLLDALLLQNVFYDNAVPLKLRAELQNIREDISNTNGNNIQDLENKITSAENTCGQCISQMSKRSSVKHGDSDAFQNYYKEFATAADRCFHRPSKKPKVGSSKQRFHVGTDAN